MGTARTHKTGLSVEEREELLESLRVRFERNPRRHKGLAWPAVEKRLKANPAKLRSLHEMERTGGEPDVVGRDGKSDVFIFMDCAPESPAGRRSLCYDRDGWLSRREHRPENNALEMAADMGIEMLTEEDYLALQRLGEFDAKTSSWVKTPPEIRDRGGALYGERRYGRIFTGHNGAQSYYGSRGFRGSLRV